MLPPKRFDENPNTATQVKKNGTEKFGMDQDGVAKKISAEDLLKIENIENGAKASVLAGHVDDKANPHAVTKAQVGLGNADNTSDMDKPISTAQQEALELKESIANVEAHKNSIMPHKIEDLKTGKTYRYGFQLSEDGNPQTIYEEIVE